MKSHVVVRALPWLIPALVFAVSGTAKLVDPAGVPPRVLHATIDPAAWPAWLRGLGAFELLLAAALFAPRTRSGAIPVAFGLLLVFSAFVSLQAADARYLSDCGCFGALAVMPRSGPAAFYGIVFRNAVLAGLLLWAHTRRREPELARRALFERTAFVTALLVLAPLFAGERVLRLHSQGRAAAKADGAVRSVQRDWALPSFEVRTPAGREVPASEALAPGDVVVFLRTNCPVCRVRAPTWVALAADLAARGRRLVLVGLDPRESLPAFKQAHGLGAVPHFVLREERDATRLGVDGVPYVLALNAEGRVAFTEDGGAAVPFGAALDLLAASAVGADVCVANALATSLFGPGSHAEPVRPALPVDGSLAVERDGRAVGRLHVHDSGLNTSLYLEAAVGVEADGERLAGVLPLVAGPYLRLVDPGLESLRALRGLTVDEALAELRRRGEGGDVRRPLWMALYRVLGRLKARP